MVHNAIRFNLCSLIAKTAAILISFQQKFALVKEMLLKISFIEEMRTI